jgi:hypothetical protein
MNLNDEMGMPLTPEEAAKRIVAELCSDLPSDEQERIKCAIKQWGDDWGYSVLWR